MPPDHGNPGVHIRSDKELSMNRLAGKVAVITGAGAGIGRATAELFAEEGAAVVIAERDEATGRDAAGAIQEAGGKALFVRTDVSDEPSVARMAAEAVAAFGAVHILVNNAAVFVLRGIEATVEEWRQTLDVNVMGPSLVAKHVVPAIRRAGGGAIVNLGSISSFIAQPNYVTYNTTKAAIIGMTRCMAMDLAPDNIRVNAVCPGVVWTRIVEEQAIAMGLDRAGADVHPQWAGAQLIHRCADPREIAYAILFLASDEASFITGAPLMVDAGYTAR
jgi:NAD(P)-dependent dehydrogenase (short-subunit alcohol dehydrogenase family)